MTTIQEVDILKKAAKRASIKAKREAKALGLTIRVVENGLVYDKVATGEKILIATLLHMKQLEPTIKKGSILKLKK